MRKTVFVLIFAALPLSSAGKEGGVTTADTTARMEKGVGSVAATTEAATTGVPASVPDSLAANADTLHIPAAVNDSFPGSPATEKSPDRPAVSEKTTVQSETEASTKSSIRKIPLTKRRYNYRQQIVLAIGMMAFIAIIMTSAQTWNPK